VSCRDDGREKVGEGEGEGEGERQEGERQEEESQNKPGSFNHTFLFVDAAPVRRGR
jgi:hypothetical protein